MSLVIDLNINPSDWHEQSPRWGHPIHSICSYMASFPPKVPHYFISRFTKPGDIVLDPFSGRGTTPGEACLMGRIGVGSDLNPIAYVLTKAKINTPKKNSVLSRLSYLISNFEHQDIDDISDNISMLYSDITLQQLSYLKKELIIENRSVDNFIMALILGGMHGDSRLPSYLSIPMPNTFSMSPNYVKGYIEKHDLLPPKHDVFDVMKHRLERIYKHQIAPTKGRAYLDDVRNLSKNFDGSKADLILTSPPYLKVIKYGKLNWIRLWMLGVDPADLDKKLDDKHTVQNYMKFMTTAINEMATVMNDDALCFIIVGQVNGNRGPGKGKQMRLGNQIRFRLKNKVDLQFIDLIDDKYNKYLRVRKNVSRIWGNTKGNATKYDQILVMCKNPEAIERKKYPLEVDWS